MNRTLGQTVEADAAAVAASESHRIWKSPWRPNGPWLGEARYPDPCHHSSSSTWGSPSNTMENRVYLGTYLGT